MSRHSAVPLLLVAILASACSVDPAAQQEASPETVATQSPRPTPPQSTPSPSHDPFDDEAFWQISAPSVPDIDRSLPVDRWDDTRGAFSIRLNGRVGSVIARGKATCMGGGQAGPPILAGDPVAIFGEDVIVRVDPLPSLTREDAAPYSIAAGGLYRDPTIEDGVWVVRARGLAVAPDDVRPAGWVEPSTFRRPLGDLDPTTQLDVIAAWRCDPLDSDRTGPPTPTPRPTPACPPAVDAPIAEILPRLTLGRGSVQADGRPGSITFSTCDDSGGDDTPWLVPEDGVTIGGGAPLVVRLTTAGTLFDPGYGAAYAAANEGMDPHETRGLTIRAGAEQGTLEVDAPPPGDWSISVPVGVNDTVHGVVFTSPYYFRVRIEP